MRKEAILHVGNSDYIYATQRDTLVLKIRTARQDVKRCELTYFSRTEPENKKKISMKCTVRDGLFDYYETKITFPSVARYQKYYFVLEDGQGQIYYVTERGISHLEPKDGYFEYLYVNENDLFQIPEWAKGILYYQIFPERFCNADSTIDPKDCQPWGTLPTRENHMGGDLKGIIRKIPYLRELGIECLYLNPIFQGDFNHKYATADYYQIDEQFGTKQDFRELMETAHSQNIRVILDGVFNHTGVHFAPFEDVLQNQKNSEYLDWFHITKFPLEVSENCYECVGAYQWMPKLVTSNPQVQQFILEVMEYWVREFGIDGWRLDVADEVDSSAWHFIRARIKKIYPQILLIGETWGPGRRLLSENGLDIVMNYLFKDAMVSYFAKESADEREFDHLLNHMLAIYHKEANLAMYNLLDSHDTARFLFECDGDMKKMKLAVAFQMLFIGSPAVFYGDEAGLSGDNDPDCRRCMVWSEEQQNRELWEWYQRLCGMRKKEKAVRYGEYATVICDPAKKVFAFVRTWEDHSVTVVFNKGEDKRISVPLCAADDALSLLTKERIGVKGIEKGTGFYNMDLMEYQGTAEIWLESYSIQVIKQKNGGMKNGEE